MKKGSSSESIKYEEKEYLNVKNLKTQFRKVCDNSLLKNDDKLYYNKKTKNQLETGKFETTSELYSN